MTIETTGSCSRGLRASATEEGSVGVSTGNGDAVDDEHDWDCLEVDGYHAPSTS
eukprot:CAMPEP_0116868584 /NCGR_PEP_ID=MMETSP0418-20121206/27278_1 /TAXON_ID=1158023 /ORGANISM="Astrosyne radiata, Strain 13vi08-1A" /LENGTH=53 /DNA_ID=CAMNT_0004504571 /DNA_START=442 /DNA_END=603 /DNA_ORIENTATION=+